MNNEHHAAPVTGPRWGRKLRMELSQMLNALLVTLPFAWCWYAFYADILIAPFYKRGNWAVIFLFFALYIAFCQTYSGFDLFTPRVSEIIYSQFLAEVFSNAILFLVIMMLMKRIPPVLPLMIAMIVELAISATWAWVAHGIYFKRNAPAKTVIVLDKREGLDELITSYGLDIRFNVIRTVPITEYAASENKIFESAEAVFLCGIHSHERNQIVKYCISQGIAAYVIPRVGDMIMSGARSTHLFHLPMLSVCRYDPPSYYLFFKRALDVCVSSLMLLVLSPLMLVVTLLIRRDGGPALYKQTRLTKDGKTFEVLKFRSMRVDAEKDGVARLSTGANDDRITRIGHVIRATRIDELPQLINILRGEMTLVGPRPERPEIAKEYEASMPEFSLRLQAKAGLTGFAQVYGKYNTTPYDKLLMDLQYIAHASIAQDLMIIFATVKILFLPESTEGVADGARTAMQDYPARRSEWKSL